MDEDLKKEIRGFALQNSSAHGGSTDSKIIIGKILGTRPELRSMTGQIIPEIQSIVKEVNAMSAADQIAELKSEYSDLTKPKPKQKQRDLPLLLHKIQVSHFLDLYHPCGVSFYRRTSLRTVRL